MTHSEANESKTTGGRTSRSSAERAAGAARAETERYGTRIINGAFPAVSDDTRVTGRNNNDLVIGPSGAGKTRGYVMPNVVQIACEGRESLVVADTKGNLRNPCRPYLRRNGYRIIDVDFTNPAASPFGYDPLHHIPTNGFTQKFDEIAIKQVSDTLCLGKNMDQPFWDEYARLFLEAFIGCVLDVCEPFDCNMASVVTLAHLSDDRIEKLFDWYLSVFPDTFAADRMRTMQDNRKADKMYASAMGILRSDLACIATSELKALYRNARQIDFPAIGEQKTAVFLEVSDSDRSVDPLVALFYTQCMRELIRSADQNTANGCRLKVPVRIILDDFATNTRIADFDNLTSVVRSRDIFLSVILQNLTQMNALYGVDGARTIVNNFDTWLYLGGADPDTVEVVSRRTNLPFHTVMDLPLDQSIVMMRGGVSKLCAKYDIDEHPQVIALREACATAKENRAGITHKKSPRKTSPKSSRRSAASKTARRGEAHAAVEYDETHLEAECNENQHGEARPGIVHDDGQRDPDRTAA